MKVRRGDFVVTARSLYESQGLCATTVKDVTDALQVRRSLFYHYFTNKDELTTAVLNSYVDEYLEALAGWKDRQVGVHFEDTVLHSVRVLKSNMFSSQTNSFLRSLGTSENAAYYLEFTDIVADRLSEFFVDTAVRTYAETHDIEVKHMLSMCYMLIYGLVGFIRHNPNVSDDVLSDLVTQTLHMSTLPAKT